MNGAFSLLDDAPEHVFIGVCLGFLVVVALLDHLARWRAR